MARETKILIKRTSSYYSDTTTKTVNPNVGNYILEFAEPMYLKDVGWLVFGEGAEYDTELEAAQHTTDPDNVVQNPITLKYIGGPTVKELVTAHKYYADATHTELYGTTTPTFQYLNASGTAEPIPASTDSNLLANTAFVHDVIETLDGNLNGTTPSAAKTLTAFSQTDGVVNATFGTISIPYSSINDTKFAEGETDKPKADGDTASIGSINRWAKADHIHPHDTTKADTSAALGDVKWNSTDKAFQQRTVNTSIYTNIVNASDLKTGLALNNVTNESKATMFASAALTGTPTATTAAAGTNNTQIATTAFVTTAVANKSVVETKRNLTSGTIYVTGVTGQDSNLYYNVSGSKNANGIKIDCATGVLMGAAWNDFAEYRTCQGTPGTVVCETGHGDLVISSERLQPGAAVISDTYGMIIGEEKEGNQPIAVAGRVLALYAGKLKDFKPGMPVCAGPFGRIYPMTREEIKEYPEAIVGYVSEIPDYDEWNNIKIANRIWIKVK